MLMTSLRGVPTHRGERDINDSSSLEALNGVRILNVALLERHPERLELEQTHLFAAMEHAYQKSDMNSLLRIEELVRRLNDAEQ